MIPRRDTDEIAIRHPRKRDQTPAAILRRRRVGRRARRRAGATRGSEAASVGTSGHSRTNRRPELRQAFGRSRRTSVEARVAHHSAEPSKTSRRRRSVRNDTLSSSNSNINLRDEEFPVAENLTERAANRRLSPSSTGPKRLSRRTADGPLTAFFSSLESISDRSIASRVLHFFGRSTGTRRCDTAHSTRVARVFVPNASKRCYPVRRRLQPSKADVTGRSAQERATPSPNA